MRSAPRQRRAPNVEGAGGSAGDGVLWPGQHGDGMPLHGAMPLSASYNKRRWCLHTAPPSIISSPVVALLRPSLQATLQRRPAALWAACQRPFATPLPPPPLAPSRCTTCWTKGPARRGRRAARRRPWLAAAAAAATARPRPRRRRSTAAAAAAAAGGGVPLSSRSGRCPRRGSGTESRRCGAGAGGRLFCTGLGVGEQGSAPALRMLWIPGSMRCFMPACAGPLPSPVSPLGGSRVDVKVTFTYVRVAALAQGNSLCLPGSTPVLQACNSMTNACVVGVPPPCVGR